MTDRKETAGVQARLEKALNALHTIGGAFQAREFLKRPHLTEPIRKSLTAKALSDKQLQELALVTWEELVVEELVERAQSVRCPVCKVPVGAPCRDRDGDLKIPHTARALAARGGDFL